jgi:hypothetical protein
VASYENFWLAIAAAAPVIALAAIVALPDTADMYQDVQRTLDEWFDSPAKLHAALQAGGATEAEAVKAMSEVDLATAKTRAVRGARPLRVIAAFIRWITIGNLMVQAALLALSLEILAYDVHVIARWLAIVLTVGGIVLLAVTVSLTSEYRTLAKAFPEMLRQQAAKQFKAGPPTASETARGTAEGQVSSSVDDAAG